MSAQHTPGPWAYRPQEYDDWGIVRIADRDENGFQRVICQANYVASPEALMQHRIDGTDPAEANARLIAAAPELLEALEAATWELPVGGPTRDNALAAIAKARGNP
jgi:hypothetical protein